MVTLGLVSVVFAAFMLYRRDDIKRMFAYSSIEHMGIISFAFGMGGPLANFAGLLAYDHAQPDQVRDLLFRRPYLRKSRARRRWPTFAASPCRTRSSGGALVLGVITIVGLPPTGIFMSEFLILTSTFARAPVLAVVLGLRAADRVGRAAYRLNGLAFGDAYGSDAPCQASYVPMFTHLALVLAAGIFLPPLLVSWFQHVAELLG